EIDEEHREEREQHPGGGEAFDRTRESEDREEREDSAEQFDHRVTRRNRGFAIAALPTEQDPAQDRDVVPRTDRMQAAAATRARLDDGKIARKAIDDDVEEAPQAESDESDQEDEERLARQPRHRSVPRARFDRRRSSRGGRERSLAASFGRWGKIGMTQAFEILARDPPDLVVFAVAIDLQPEGQRGLVISRLRGSVSRQPLHPWFGPFHSSGAREPVSRLREVAVDVLQESVLEREPPALGVGRHASP